MSVAMIKTGAKGFANAVRRFAIKDKRFAQELVFNHGIRSEITPNALKGITKDIFDKTGKLTQRGQKEVADLIEQFALPKNATWDDALDALRRYKDSFSR